MDVIQRERDVSNPDIHAREVKTPVATSQVAPAILEFLGIDSDALKSVRVEHTGVLPSAIASKAPKIARDQIAFLFRHSSISILEICG
jgi:hypothetical protein